jgi:ubiquinone/menaquinone biosynthesis C-methylase UbiE
MGRYSTRLATQFADTIDFDRVTTALDMGSGPGALTGVLVERLGASSVSACDPSTAFAAECAARYPGVDVRVGRGESLPFDDSSFSLAMAQLVLHFVTEPMAAAEELRRVVREGGIVAGCVWEFTEGMQMLRAFWDAALIVDPSAPDEATTMRFGRSGEIAELFESAGFVEIVETKLTVTSLYHSFEELWSGFLAGVGPAGSYLASLDDRSRESLRRYLFEGVGEPAGPFELSATAISARGHAPE